MPSKDCRRAWGRLVTGRLLPSILLSLGLAACVPPYQVAAVPAGQAQAPPPPTKVYFYPNQGQSQEQQDRDSYECYLWAKAQTGFDPSAPNLAPHTRVEVVPQPPPGAGTAVGAVTGAILGAAVSSHHNQPEGALLGALAGGLIGSASDAARQEQAARLQEYYDRQAGQNVAATERQAADYRRALAACLEGRGYTVR